MGCRAESPRGEKGVVVVSTAVSFLVGWANVPFAMGLGVVAVFMLLQLTGVLGLLGGGDDGGDGGDAHDGAADAAHADGASVHDAPDPEHDAALGVIPASWTWQAWAATASFVGYALNLPFASRPGGPPLWTLVYTLPVGLAAGAACASALRRVLTPVLGSREQEATRVAELVGKAGVVISSRVDASFGEIRVRDKSGHDLRIVCRLADSARAPREGEAVVVVDLDERGRPCVQPLDEEPLVPGRAAS